MLTLTDVERARKVARLVHPVFVSAGWTYGLDHRVPEVEDLELAILDLIDSWRNDPNITISSGRFVVRREPFTVDVDYRIALEFSR